MCCEAEACNRSEAGCGQQFGEMAVNTIVLQVMYYAKGPQYKQIIYQSNSFVVSDTASCTFVPVHQNSLHSIICPCTVPMLLTLKMTVQPCPPLQLLCMSFVHSLQKKDLLFLIIVFLTTVDIVLWDDTIY